MSENVENHNLSTKDRIMIEALWLFSEKSFSGVSMRDIAKKVGINVASIYNHFSSKEEICTALYDYYEEQWNLYVPKLDEMLKLAETEDVYSLVEKLDFHYPPDVQAAMDRIMIMAAKDVHTDEASLNLIKDHIFHSTQTVTGSLLKRLIELGRVEPFDVDAIVLCLEYLGFGAAYLNNSSLGIDYDGWRAVLKLARMIIKTTGK